LLIKHRDKYSEAGYDANAYLKSAVSGRSIEQIYSQGTLIEADDGAGRRGKSAK